VAKVATLLGSAFALRDVINTTQQWGLALDNLHDTLGLSGDAAAKWTFQARVVGTTADDVATAFGQLTNKIGNSLPAIAKGEDDFTKWGISVLDASGALRSADDILDQTRQRVNALGPGLAARQLEMDLFGRSGGKLHDFLALSNDEIARMDEELRGLGLPTNVAELEAMNRESNRLGLMFDAIKIKLGSALLPVLLAVGRGLAQLAGFVKVLGEALRSPLGILKEVIGRLGAFLTEVKSIGFGGALQKLVEDFVAKARELLPKIGEELDKLGPLGWAIKAIATGIVLEKIGVGGLLSALFSAAPQVGTTVLTATKVAGAAAQLGITTAIVMVVAATLFATGREDYARMLEASAGIYLAIQGTTLALRLGGAAAPWTLAITAGLVLGLVLDAIITDEAKAGIVRTLQNNNFWADLLGIAAIAGATAAFGPAGLAISIPVVLTLKWLFGGLDIGGILEWLGEWKDRNILGERPDVRVPRAPREPDIPPPSPTIDIPASQFPGGVIPPSILDAIGGKFAHGGIVTRPTLSLIGEAGPEAVVPLGRGGAVGATYITVNVSGNVTRSEKELADIVGSEIMRRIGTRRAVAF